MYLHISLLSLISFNYSLTLLLTYIVFIHLMWYLFLFGDSYNIIFHSYSDGPD